MPTAPLQRNTLWVVEHQKLLLKTITIALQPKGAGLPLKDSRSRHCLTCSASRPSPTASAWKPMWASSLTRTFLLTTLSSATRTLRVSLLRPLLLHLEALAAAVACSDSPEGLPASDCPVVAATSVAAVRLCTSATDLGGELLHFSMEGGLKQAEAALRQSLAARAAGRGPSPPTTDSRGVRPRTFWAFIRQGPLPWHVCEAEAALRRTLASSSEALLLQAVAATESKEV